jgi:hypothetical protein
MIPSGLTSTSFTSYPPEARAFAVAHLRLLQSLPLVFLAILLREISTYDWRFPAERDALDRQMTFLDKLSLQQRDAVFSDLRLVNCPRDLEISNWVEDPGGFMEKLTASLWSTHQMDVFRKFATTYQQQVDSEVPPPQPVKPRVGIVVFGAGMPHPAKSLFAKLTPYGVTFTAIKQEDGWQELLKYASARVQPTPTRKREEFRHWYIDGGLADPAAGLVPVSYGGLEAARRKLLQSIQNHIASGTMGPEGLRSALALMKPAEIGLAHDGGSDVIDHFKLTLLTEGSGTQIFSTTFVQWAARECIRRAEPETLLVRFTPRQRAVGMDQMLTPGFATEIDAEGSLLDAQMGAYYTWINLRRLRRPEQLRFLVWQQDSSQALMIGPGLPQGTSSTSSLTVRQLLEL